MAPLSLYIHVPFCSLKCAYCDFNSYAGIDELIPRFWAALLREIDLWSPLAEGRIVETVYFGGGTPSLLPPEMNREFLAAIKDAFTVAPGAEVSIEANPGTVNERNLESLVAAGFNRISFGVQSFHDEELAFLDRVHSVDDARHGVRWAKAAGFSRVSLDLIYGLPGQDVYGWKDNLDQALELDPGHISAYALTIEVGTRLAYDVDRGDVAAPDPDLQADMYEVACESLAASGYAQYEISNWARSGQECRHNFVYWRNGEWLGLGPGAHSHWGGHRFATIYSPRRYIELLVDATLPEPGLRPADALQSMPQVTLIESESPDMEMADSAILGLRLNEGLHVADFERQFGLAFDDAYGPAIGEMTEAGLIDRSNGTVRLTSRGRLLANEVFVRLLPD